jgi:hypothetical protein
MSKFLTTGQIAAIFELGTSALELEPMYVYQDLNPNTGFGVGTIDAFGGAPPANIGPRTATLGWTSVDETRREDWWDLLGAANSLIATAIEVNNINPYPLPPHNYGTSNGIPRTYQDWLAGRAPLLGESNSTTTIHSKMNMELNRLAAVSDSESFYNWILTDTSTGNRFVKEDNIYINSKNSFKGLYTGGLAPPPAAFTFGYVVPPGSLDASDQQYGPLEMYCALRIIIRLYALHNVLYGSELKPLSNNFSTVFSDRSIIPKILGNIDAGLNYFREAIDDYPDAVQAALDAGEEVQQQQLEDLLEDVAENFTFVESLTGGEINAISQRRVYKKYFATTFNEDLITAIPLIQNLYLTEKYFSGIGQAMLPPKRAALSVLLNTINNDDEFQMEPDTSRPASAAAIRHSAGEFDVNAREFILRMLIQTPIKILEGLVEMIDPHMAITKIIKIGSATAFDQGIEYLNPVAQEIQQSLANANPPIHTNITGQALMEVVLCFVEAGLLDPLEVAFGGILDAVGLEDELLRGDYMPSVSLDGIDFTGTIPGMFMIPPSPIGLLYLLLELVRNALDDNDALEEAPPPQEC